MRSLLRKEGTPCGSTDQCLLVDSGSKFVERVYSAAISGTDIFAVEYRSSRQRDEFHAGSTQGADGVDRGKEYD